MQSCRRFPLWSLGIRPSLSASTTADGEVDSLSGHDSKLVPVVGDVGKTMLRLFDRRVGSGRNGRIAVQGRVKVKV